VDETTVYYERRAAEYDRICRDGGPRRAPQAPRTLGRVPGNPGRASVPDALGSTPAKPWCSSLLELACGTGYWTEQLTRTAARVCGVDVNGSTLAVARTRAYGPAPVTLVQADVYRAPPLAPGFDAGFAGLWLSHVDRARMGAFLDAFHAALAPGSAVMLFDERESESRAAATARVDAAGNRYEKRRLADGSRFEILKNWYDAATLEALFRDHGHTFWSRELDHFWVCGYITG
jgi:SAM-dependent methyltransferase